MKNILILLVSVLFLFSCKTQEQRARRLIERANKLYPIDSIITSTHVVDTVIKWDTVFVAPADTVIFKDTVVYFNGKFIPYENKKVHDDEKATVYATLKENGSMTFYVHIKERKFYITGETHYKEIIVTKRFLTRMPPIHIKGFFYWSGIASWSLIVIFVILFLINLRYGIFKRSSSSNSG